MNYEQHIDVYSVQSDQTEGRMKRIMRVYNCDAETAQAFMDLRDDGHGLYQAEVMAGVRDPSS